MLAQIDWLPGGSLPAQIIVLGGATTVIGAFIKWGIKGVKTCLAFFNRIDKALTNVESQLYPNGGASLRDAVNRIQAALAIENVASKSKPADRAAALIASDFPAPVIPEPPSEVIERLDDIGDAVGVTPSHKPEFGNRPGQP